MYYIPARDSSGYQVDFIVDENIWHELSAHKWTAQLLGGRWYARASIKCADNRWRTASLLSYVTGGRLAEPINGSSLDLRRDNLRIKVHRDPSVAIDPGLHTRIVARARREGVTIKSLVHDALVNVLAPSAQ